MINGQNRHESYGAHNICYDNLEGGLNIVDWLLFVIDWANVQELRHEWDCRFSSSSVQNDALPSKKNCQEIIDEIDMMLVELNA